MGAEADATWLIDKGGYEAAFTGLNATLRDYARLGLLLANDGAARRPADHPGRLGARGDDAAGRSSSSPGRRTRPSSATATRPGSCPARSASSRCAACAGRCMFVDPGSKLVMVHTAAGNVGDNIGELFSLWFAVTKRLAD